MTTQPAVSPQSSHDQVTLSLVEYVQAVDASSNQPAPTPRPPRLRYLLPLLALVVFVVLIWLLLHDTVIKIPFNVRIFLYLIAIFVGSIAAYLGEGYIMPALLHRLGIVRSRHPGGGCTGTIKLWFLICLILASVVGAFASSAPASDDPNASVAPGSSLSADAPTATPFPTRTPRPAFSNGAATWPVGPAANRPPLTAGGASGARPTATVDPIVQPTPTYSAPAAASGAPTQTAAPPNSTPDIPVGATTTPTSSQTPVQPSSTPGNKRQPGSEANRTPVLQQPTSLPAEPPSPTHEPAPLASTAVPPTSRPASTPVPATPRPTSTSIPPTTVPTYTPLPTSTSIPPTTAPTNTPLPTSTPLPTETPRPTETPTAIPLPTNTPAPSPTPTSTPRQTETPGPTETPTSMPTPIPTSDIVPCTLDTYVNGSQPDRAYGSDRVIKISRTHPEQWAFIRCSVLAGAPVRRVVLRLHVAEASDGGKFYAIAGAWDESMTWRTRPTQLGAELAHPGPVEKGTWVEVELTSIARSSDGTISIAILSPSERDVEYSSLDGDSRYRPHLRIDR